MLNITLETQIATKLHEKHMELQTLSVQRSPQDSLKKCRNNAQLGWLAYWPAAAAAGADAAAEASYDP